MAMGDCFRFVRKPKPKTSLVCQLGISSTTTGVPLGNLTQNLSGANVHFRDGSQPSRATLRPAPQVKIADEDPINEQ